MHRLAAATLVLVAACAEPTSPREELIAVDGSKTLSRVVEGRTETLIARDNGTLVGVTKVSRNSQGALVTLTPAGRPSVSYFATNAQLAMTGLRPNLDLSGAQADLSGPAPWGCGWVGRALLFSVWGLFTATTALSPFAPLAFFVATAAVANNVYMFARCKEWYANNPGAP
jgi:hypothetical protein